LESSGRSRAIVFDLGSNAPNPLNSMGFGIWSPDSQKVALWTADGVRIVSLADGAEQVITSLGTASPDDWSLDGRWLLHSGTRALSLQDSRDQAVGNAVGGGNGAFSPDQKWIAFNLDSRVYVTPFPGPGPRIPVSSLTGGAPRWRGDGKELYFATAAQNGERTIVAVPVTAAGSSLTFGTPQPLFKAQILARNRTFGATRDGKRFVVIVPGEPDPVTLTVQVGGFGTKK
jgi:Tol biopolymer transport system component